MKLYPLKFLPQFNYRIWGGDKLKTVLNKKYTEDSIGESWEISDVKGNETLVENGAFKGQTLKQLIKTYKGDFLGKTVYERFENDFPLLIKFIDAKTPLSIQVHPNNEVSKIRHNSFGKNEMWYVMDADKEAELIVGFEKEITKDTYESHIENNTILEVLHHEEVSEGDTFYIPTGRVHAIGAGVLLAEIQQTSDITYRMYDYNRVDSKTGKKRELHVDLAADVIDFSVQDNYKTSYAKELNVSNTLVHTPYFKSNFIRFESMLTKDYSNIDSFVIYVCVKGAIKIQCNDEIYSLSKGESILFPASVNLLKIIAELQTDVLEVYM
ncbi:type I phosphomannose isomerase catalytic subunit [Lutibacter citreus]|uniref:type I phosphomannose isomerase catalytic subunit n=1 Tax=Lutibacter citreus TaxID=2138210 RepID=UPI000DBE1DF3|nr:type I phosphomannose isomerase catalytic subunit [Lutibacter citreus]